MLIRDFLAYAVKCLKPISETAQLEAQVILAHVLGKERVWVLAHPEQKIEAAELQAAEEALTKLTEGVPLAYVVGEWEFYGLPFWVNESVLVPRPETELLVEAALQWLNDHPQSNAVLDVGTGSGCIAVSLAYHLPRLSIVGIDRSWSALQMARKNCQRHGVLKAVAMLQSDLCLALLSKNNQRIFDLICANLPYVPSSEARKIKAEPQFALDGGDDGLRLIRRFLPQAALLIKPQGLILLEIGYGQDHAVEELAFASFPKAAITLLKDLAGKKRLCAIAT